MSHQNELRVGICGAGSGGHVYPAWALAQALSQKLAVKFFYFVRPDSFEQSFFQDKGDLILLKAWQFNLRLGLWDRLKIIWRVWLESLRLAKVLKRERIQVVFSTGGFVSVPVGLACLWSRIPLVIWEGNFYPGLANRLLARWAKMVFIAFEGAEKWFKNRHTQVVGVPLRAEIVERAKKYFYAPKNPQECWRVLVLGGSQGALFLNKLIMELIERYHRRIEGRWFFEHQVGLKMLPDFMPFYQKYPQLGRCHGFIQQMADSYETADIVISRAGASAVYEIMAFGKPAIFIPLLLADNHQWFNVSWLSQKGLAYVFPQDQVTVEGLWQALEDLRSSNDLNERFFRLRDMVHWDGVHVMAQKIQTLLLSGG